MWDAYRSSQDDEILQADPLTLVQMLYRGALDAVRRARVCLAQGEIEQRGRQISKALAIIAELTVSLDRERGGEVARNLAELYDYLQRQLSAAHLRASAEKLAEVEALLSTLAESWEACRTAEESVPTSMPSLYAEPSAYAAVSYQF